MALVRAGVVAGVVAGLALHALPLQAQSGSAFLFGTVFARLPQAPVRNARIVHVGDGRRGLSLLRRVVEETEIPPAQFLPTHMNRNPSLFQEAIDWVKAGGLADFTTSTVPAYVEEGEVKASLALRRMIDAGAPVTSSG